MTQTRPRILVTRRLPPLVEETLQRHFDATLNLADQPLGEAGLREALATCDGLLCTLTDELHAGLFEGYAGPCRILANFGVGVNHIAVEAARRAGLEVTNTPGVLTECTADLTMALILMTVRRIGEGERLLREGRWTGWAPTGLLGHRLSDRTLGIVGFGRIGQAVARRAAAGFGMRVVGWGPRRPAAESLERLGVAWAGSLEELLGEADVVSLHCPLTSETRGLINRERLGRMRADAVLVNTARGEIVEAAALIAALQSGELAGAGLDVYWDEPEVPAELVQLPGVVLLPHLGSATVETRTDMGLRAVKNLRAFFRGEVPPDPVR